MKAAVVSKYASGCLCKAVDLFMISAVIGEYSFPDLQEFGCSEAGEPKGASLILLPSITLILRQKPYQSECMTHPVYSAIPRQTCLSCEYA